jgi:SAM-dependent methyltransferase
LDERAASYSDNLLRFAEVLKQLPPLPVLRVLDLGCGAARCALAIRGRWPGATIFGVDWMVTDVQKRVPTFGSIQADLRALPLRRGQFGLVVIRHPNVDQVPETWKTAIQSVPNIVCEDGLLLVTCYNLAELERVRFWLSGQTEIRVSPERLTQPDGVGHDRYVAAWRICCTDR